MRNKRFIGVLAVAGALAVGITGVAIGAPAVQTIDVIVGGKAKPALPKKELFPPVFDWPAKAPKKELPPLVVLLWPAKAPKNELPIPSELFCPAAYPKKELLTPVELD